MLKLSCLAALVIMAGCAPTVLTRNGSNVGFDDDMRACEYDAMKYAGNGDPSMRTVVGSGIEEGLRRRDLKLACMRSKGWTQQHG